jgi:hypothetical protein
MISPAKFVLHCDHLNSQFRLTQEGDAWERSFDTFDDAYECAESLATGKFPLTILNARGEVVLESSVSPLGPELTAARSHWRRLALAD